MTYHYRFHAHGDSSIYGALVELTKDWKNNQILIEGHGNFGSIESSSDGSGGAAAMRYTEARLSKYTEDVFLADLNKDVVPFLPSYDGTDVEPEFLPTRLPNFLINGSNGIGVGMVSSSLPYAVSEIIDALVALMKNPKITTKDLMMYVPAPDLPTGGILDASNIEEIYETGTGKIKLRGKVEVEELKGGKRRLVVTEIPYTMVGAGINKFLSDVVDLAEAKEIEITDVLNQISKDGTRLVIELKKDADIERTKAVLYKKTKLEDTFGVNMLIIHKGKPQVLGLRDMLKNHIEFQYEIYTNKYTHLLSKENDKKEIQEGLIKACDVIDLIIEILRGAKTVKDAKACLVNGNTANITFKKKTSEKEAAKLKFTERQAQAILEMRLQKLIGLELDALKNEYAQTLKNIAKYEDILKNKKSMMKIIIDDLEKIKKEYGRPRRTKIEQFEEIVIEEPKVQEQDVVMLMDRFGYARTMDPSVYEKNKEAADKENKYILTCKNIGKICLFTNTGKMHQIKVSDLPYGNFRNKGIPIDNVSNYNSAEEDLLWIGAENELEGKKFLFTTKQGMMKQVPGSEFAVSKKTIAATKLNDGDEVLSIEVVEDRTMLVLQTKDGYFLKFLAEQIPEKKKGAVGVRGIKLTKNDVLEKVHMYIDGVETKIKYKNKELSLNHLKEAKRDGVGTKK